MPAKDFYVNELSEQERGKLKATNHRLADDGRVENRERFKKVEGTEDCLSLSCIK